MMTTERERTDTELDADERQPGVRGRGARTSRAKILQILRDRGVLDSYKGIEEPGTFVFAINGETLHLRNVEVETFVRGLLVGLRWITGLSQHGELMADNLAQFAPHDSFSRGMRHGIISQSDYTIGWKYEQEVLALLGRLPST